MGQSIEAEIDMTLRYDELVENANALWTLLLFCGYLKATGCTLQGVRLMCQLNIPNIEFSS